jgi:molecular chaperone HscB
MVSASSSIAADTFVPCLALLDLSFPLAALPLAHRSHQPTFDLDPAALEKRYKLLQWQLHPDKSVGKTPEERQYSAEQATLINQAYGVLRNPLSRANYMVGTHN